MPATKKGIYHNLKESKYTVSNSEIVFFFSSEFYLNNFLDRYENNRIVFVDKLKRITDENPLNMNVLADIALYKKIEKRGFRSLLKGVEINHDDLYNYALRKMTTLETPEWKRINSPKINHGMNRRIGG